MKTLILPGFSQHNEEWAIKVKDHLPGSEYTTWHHWQTGNNKDFSPEDEAKKIVDDIPFKGADIIAKSIGTYITVRLISKVQERIRKVVLCGIPLNDLSEEDKNAYLSINSLGNQTILVIQNSLDPHGTYEDVKNFITAINQNIEVRMKTSADHEYPYYNDFIKFLNYGK